MSDAFGTWAVAREEDAGCRIEVASDGSLDEGATIRTIADGPSILSSGVEYYLNVSREDAELLARVLAGESLRDEDEGDTASSILWRVNKIREYQRTGPQRWQDVTPATLHADREAQAQREVDDEVEVNERALFSGDWHLTDESAGHRVPDGYAVAVAYEGIPHTVWSGGESFLATRRVLEAIAREQDEFAKSDPGGTAAWQQIRFDGDDAVLVTEGEDDWPIERYGDLYVIGFGWAWTRVDEREATGEIVRMYAADDEQPSAARTILIHLNVTVPADDPRSADEIVSLVEREINSLDSDPQARGIVVDTALAEEV